MNVILTSAFSETMVTPDGQIAERDKVVARWSSSSVNSGEFLNMPATGKAVKASGTDVSRIIDGQIVGNWSQTNMMDLMQQLGVDAPAG